jgi:hypothetical protein
LADPAQDPKGQEHVLNPRLQRPAPTLRPSAEPHACGATVHAFRSARAPPPWQWWRYQPASYQEDQEVHPAHAARAERQGATPQSHQPFRSVPPLRPCPRWRASGSRARSPAPGRVPRAGSGHDGRHCARSVPCLAPFLALGCERRFFGSPDALLR